MTGSRYSGRWRFCAAWSAQAWLHALGRVSLRSTIAFKRSVAARRSCGKNWVRRSSCSPRRLEPSRTVGRTGSGADRGATRLSSNARARRVRFLGVGAAEVERGARHGLGRVDEREQEEHALAAAVEVDEVERRLQHLGALARHVDARGHRRHVGLDLLLDALADEGDVVGALGAVAALHERRDDGRAARSRLGWSKALQAQEPRRQRRAPRGCDPPMRAMRMIPDLARGRRGRRTRRRARAGRRRRRRPARSAACRYARRAA